MEIYLYMHTLSISRAIYNLFIFAFVRCFRLFYQGFSNLFDVFSICFQAFLICSGVLLKIVQGFSMCFKIFSKVIPICTGPPGIMEPPLDYGMAYGLSLT